MKRFFSVLLVLAILSGMYVPSFAAEAGSLENWELYHSGTLDATMEIDNAEFHSGSSSVKIKRSTPQKSQTYAMLQQAVNVEKGKTYKYSLLSTKYSVSISGVTFSKPY